MSDPALAGLCFAGLAGRVPWAVMLVLVVAAVWDLRVLRIPNGLVLALGLLFVLVLAPCLPWPVLGWRLLAVGLVLALGIAAFAVGLFGGGDVKLLAVLLLFVPSGGLVLFAFVMALSLLLSIALILAARRAVPEYDGGWGVLRERQGRLPMGLAFCLGGLVFWGVL